VSHRTRRARLLRLGALCALAWTLPAQAQPRRFQAVGSSATHACAIDGEGTLECRGASSGTPPAGKFLAVGVGHDHTCAIRKDGTVTCWGSSGPYCDNANTNAPAGTFTAIAAGPNYTCAIRADQTLSCWGCQDYVRPPAGRFLAISAGDTHACGITVDHGVVCWGEDGGGKAKPPAGRFLAVAAGHRRTCAIREDGSLVSWDDGPAVQPAPPGGRFLSVSAGGEQTCAIRDDHAAVCWTRRDARPPADPASREPGQLQADGRPFQAISVNRERAWGLTADGSVICLGERKVCGPWYHPSTRPSPGNDSGSDSLVCRLDIKEIGARLDGLLDDAARAPWVEGFRAAHGRPPRVAIGSVDRGGEAHSSTFRAELARIHEAIATNGKVIPLECSFEFERFDERGHHYREDCRWDAERRFDVELPDFVLDLSLEPAAPPTSDPAASSRLHALSLAVRDASSQSVAWSRRDEVPFACRQRPPAVAHRSNVPWRLGLGLGLRLAAEVGSPFGDGDDRHYLGLTAGAFPLRYRLGCAGHDFRHCDYAVLGATASAWPRWYSVDAGLLELGMFTGSATLGALIQPAGDGATRYGAHANAFVGLGPLATVGVGLRAWAMVSPPGEVGVRLTLDLAFHDYGDFGR